jgi:hypothetical protein
MKEIERRLNGPKPSAGANRWPFGALWHVEPNAISDRQSVTFDAQTPAWEYLVEGIIAVVDEAALSYVREHGAHRRLMAQPFSHP